jgi:malate dehydrogenase (oxaloacetate-decarboxylating)
MNDIYEESLELHAKNHGKIETKLKIKCDNAHDLALAYSPGVAAPCIKINEDSNLSYTYTNRSNIIAVISDCTAVLGLGKLSAEAGMPVMEGKAFLFKRFADIDAIPLVLNTNDPEEIINTCKILEKSFGGINLEDISAPNCVKIERELIEQLDIPVFHDDQHGTAIVVLSGLINALKIIDKKAEECRVVVSGTGAAGSNVIKTLYNYGFTNIVGFDKDGCLYQHDKNKYDFLKKELLDYVNKDDISYNNLEAAMKNADIFIGMSAPNLVSKEMVASMNDKAVVFALANPTPEINYQDAKDAGAFIIATGRSDYPNQVNNLLAFPYIFKGALEAKATRITDKDKLAAANAIASLITDQEVNTDYIIPSPFDERLNTIVVDAVKQSCIEGGYIRSE